jgi:sensor histidine kinase YesM
MEIQRFRYGDRVQVNFEVDQLASLCLVPRMILQPLVENACIHGIEPSKREGLITIRAWIDRDLLFCEVEDNGIGMKIDPDSGEPIGKTDGLQERMSGIGLRHIREKIKLYYGNDYKMRVISKEQQGSTIRLSLPVHQSEV